MMRAAIAIGSNSIRMLAADRQDGSLCRILRGREEIRLFSEGGKICVRELS